MNWLETYRTRVTDASSALRRAITAGHRVYLSTNCGEPQTLSAALGELAPALRRVEIVQLLAMGQPTFVRPELAESNVRLNAMFIGPGVRDAVNSGYADYTPIFLSEIPRLFRKQLPIDVAVIQLSPPDEHGFCSFGVSVDIAKPAAEQAQLVVAEVNPQMPRTLGDAFIHVSKLDYIVESERPIRELESEPFGEVHQRIAQHVSQLIDDGATLQLGIGAIPNAVLAALGDRRDLGVHTEMFSDGVVNLVERGVITNEKKTLHPGKIISSFVMGSRALYDFIDNNPIVEMHPSDYTNDPEVVARNDNMVAVNSAISVDLTGQVNADTIGLTLYSGFGGQVDFIRGAARSKGGKPIIALPSVAKNKSRIVPTLALGAGVVTSRADVHYVVTEYGVAYLHGRTIRERARALIDIAHPDFREELERFAHAQHYL